MPIRRHRSSAHGSRVVNMSAERSISQPSRWSVCSTPPNAAAGFEERDLRGGIELRQAMGGRQAGDAAADDGDAARAVAGEQWGERDELEQGESAAWTPIVAFGPLAVG